MVMANTSPQVMTLELQVEIYKSYDRKTMWYDHTDKKGGEFLYVREQEVYLNMCRRWRDMQNQRLL